MEPGLECLDQNSECQGDVAMCTVDGLKYWPRCEFHHQKRLDAQVHINELLAPVPAGWFDEAYAGETWDDEGY